MITILLIVLLVLFLSGGFYGYRGGYITYGNPLGIILIIIVVLLLLGFFTGPIYRYW